MRFGITGVTIGRSPGGENRPTIRLPGVGSRGGASLNAPRSIATNEEIRYITTLAKGDRMMSGAISPRHAH
jgi:hypothetical protein